MFLKFTFWKKHKNKNFTNKIFYLQNWHCLMWAVVILFFKKKIFINVHLERNNLYP